MVDENNPLENLKEVMEAKVAENAAGEDALVETDGEAAPETAAATDTLVEEAPVLAEPKIDEHGRSYATGKRKDAVAR
ncbi:MAG: hypothetical protein QGG84_12525, partial [Rhodospirillales bacterium]|nr:hypothetical protein [Rhodospirillales bacterium]